MAKRVGEVGSGAGFKRLGYLAETILRVEPALVAAARARLSAGIVKLDPDVRERGRLSKRWGLWLNVRLDASPANA
jgi:predicted transcriptional regulator of viral defense system